MTAMTLTVPLALKDYIRERVAVGDFADPGDYVPDLIRARMLYVRMPYQS